MVIFATHQKGGIYALYLADVFLATNPVKFFRCFQACQVAEMGII
jgi:hypothetical protein